MARTTVDLDASILKELKRRSEAEGKTLGRLISELVAAALKDNGANRPEEPLDWAVQPMKARVPLEDKDAVYAALNAQ
ncbi:MAG: antitoxin [Actinobacteria bacterium]|jgi:hypothetical protein|nr:antitoxin [Actinomycetota bacterium]MDQ3532762.1 antitoxin [Actinomycetota bacterium]